MKQLNHKLVIGNTIITQADKGKTVVIIYSDEYSKKLHTLQQQTTSFCFQKILPTNIKTHRENTVTMQLNHRQTKEKVPNPKETFTTNTKSTTEIT